MSQPYVLLGLSPFVSCGGGTQTATVVCKDAAGATVADTLCTATKPATSVACNTAACATYSWLQSAWGTCSASCGGGVQTAQVTCVQNGGTTIVADSFCTATKPATS